MIPPQTSNMALYKIIGVMMSVATICFLALLVLRLFRSDKRRLPLPPGPRPLPILGNILDLPREGTPEWEHWLKHKDLYGPISSVTVLGQTIIILHDSQATFDLMEKRSALYSDRPNMVFAMQMSGWGDLLVSLQPSDRLRAYRKYIHGAIGSKSQMARFSNLQITETRRFLFRVLQSPENLVQHIKREAGAIILKMAYGYNIAPHEQDPLVQHVDEAMDQFSKAAVAGAWLVDVVPALRHLPDWVPGTEFKRTARYYKKTLTEVIERPYQFVKQRTAAGSYEPSFTSQLLETEGQSDEGELRIKNVAASLYTAGADTVGALSVLECIDC